MSQPAATSPHRMLLNPSELGTKEYWDATYTRELSNHAADATDEGTIWFSESNAEEAILSQLDLLAQQGLLHRETVSSSHEATVRASSFLDLGTGNGHLLFTLRDPPARDDEDQDQDDDDADGKRVRRGWKGAMLGLDYSPASVALARRLAAQKGLAEDVRFEEWDLFSPERPPQEWFGVGEEENEEGGFDVVLDKGTFDAISLMPSQQGGGAERHPCEVYRERVQALVKKGGFLVVTSCNWTKGELLEWLAPADEENRREQEARGGDEGFVMYSEARYPSFTFGGRTGQTIVTLVLRRKGQDGMKG